MDANLRGTDGPLNVAMVRTRYPALDMVIDAAKANGYPYNPDYNGMIRKALPITR